MFTLMKASSGMVHPKKMGPCGGAGGSEKDMNVTGITRIVKISVRHGWAIDALTVYFLRNGNEESSGQWGSAGGNLTEFTLKTSEHITSVKGHTDNFNGAYVVRSLKFETNLGSYGPYGQEQGVAFELSAIIGEIVGFFGRSGNCLDALGIYVLKPLGPVERLITGFQQFKIEDKKPELFEPLKKGQKPKFMLFTCSDSRVSPSVTLRFQPCEAFIVRNIANMVPPFDKTRYAGVGSAIEYAVHHLHVENIVVIEHSKCGGIEALMTSKFDGTSNSEFVEDWVKIGFAAAKRVHAEHGSKSLEDQCAICEKEAVKVSLENLKTYPFVMEAWKKGALKLFGAHYDFVTGKFVVME